MRDYYYAVREYGASQGQFIVSKHFAGEALTYSIFNMFGEKDTSLFTSLELCDALLGVAHLESREQMLLLSALKQIADFTVITKDETEENAVYKLRCRIAACEIASTLYRQGITDDIILRWKEISEDENEFSEIRHIIFVEE